MRVWCVFECVSACMRVMCECMCVCVFVCTCMRVMCVLVCVHVPVCTHMFIASHSGCSSRRVMNLVFSLANSTGKSRVPLAHALWQWQKYHRFKTTSEQIDLVKAFPMSFTNTKHMNYRPCLSDLLSYIVTLPTLPL